MSRLHSTGFSRSRVASYCSSCSRVRRSTKRSIAQPARPNRRNSFAGAGIDRETVGVVRVALRRCGPRACCDPTRWRSRAAATASRATRRRARSAPTRRNASEHRRGGDAADHLDQAAGDEVHRERQRRTGHAEIEVARQRQVAGERRVFEMSHAGRPHARLRQPIVQPRGRPIAEVGAERLVDRRQRLQQHEHHADERQRPGEAARRAAPRRRARRSQSRRSPAARRAG